MLYAKGIHLLPDVLANAGGVVVSTLEWEQNLKQVHWDEADVFQRLEKTLSNATVAVLASSDTLQTDLRRGAFAVSLDRLEKAFELTA